MCIIKFRPLEKVIKNIDLKYQIAMAKYVDLLLEKDPKAINHSYHKMISAMKIRRLNNMLLSNPNQNFR